MERDAAEELVGSSSMSIAAHNAWVGRVIVEELARLRTPLVCLAPGARCAPL